MLAVSKFKRLEIFLNKLKNDIYPEPLMNEKFIEEGIESIKNRIKPDDKVLDIGCGHGYAMNIFKAIGANPVGITLSEDDKNKAEALGHEVKIMDMSFPEFEDNYFDGIWARHSLEHSIMPYFTLSEWYRILKPGGWMYVEIPAPDTDSRHEFNGNHYSVLPLQMAGSLLVRTGFINIKSYVIEFKNQNGNDIYFRLTGDKFENIS